MTVGELIAALARFPADWEVERTVFSPRDLEELWEYGIYLVESPGSGKVRLS